MDLTATSRASTSWATPDRIGRVASLWRYPVKSLGGERVTQVLVDHRGVIGDRRWAVVGSDGKFGSGKTTRRFRRMPGLLSSRAETETDGSVWIHLPGGERRLVTDAETAAAIGSIVGEEVRLLEESDASHMDDSPVHVVTTGDIAVFKQQFGETVDEMRFRPNVVIEADASGSEEWAGRRLQIGTVELAIAKPTERCVMVTQVQPGHAFLPSLLGEIERRLGGMFGQYATVVQPGVMTLGDPILLR